MSADTSGGKFPKKSVGGNPPLRRAPKAPAPAAQPRAAKAPEKPRSLPAVAKPATRTAPAPSATKPAKPASGKPASGLPASAHPVRPAQADAARKPSKTSRPPAPPASPAITAASPRVSAQARPSRPKPPKPTPAPTDARELAFDAVLAWAEGRIEHLDEALDNLPGFDPRDQALARELALGAVRWLRLYDHLAGRFLRPGPQPEALLVALRIGAHQLFALDRVPPYSAVDASVALLRRAGMPHLTQVANAVLRRLAELRQPTRTIPGPAGRISGLELPEDPGTLHSLPDLLLRDLHDHLPDGASATVLGALNVLPHLCTRWRPGQPTPRGISVLKREDVWTWWGDPREALAGPVADGLCVVQDRTQGEPIRLGAPLPGDLVLDCCAAPGGKALALADLGCRVVAADVNPTKVSALPGKGADGFLRLVADGRRPALVPGAFKVVFVDAPCSNSGVIGRRPEARWRYSREKLEQLAIIQRDLLAAAATLVAPGGRLVYSTCSISPRENQGIAHHLDGWRLRCQQTTWPDAWRGGGYVAVLVRN